MSVSLNTTAVAIPDPTLQSGVANNYRMLWRWHFFAGLFVMPFLLVLAITGTLYCFKPQLEPILYPHLFVVHPVPPETAKRLPSELLLASAQKALPAASTPRSFQVTANPARSAEFVFRLPDGDQQSVFVNPYDGSVLGTLSVANRFMQVVRMLHRKLLLGQAGELVMELAACWTLVMIGTGIALWWPRRTGGQGMQWLPRLTLRGRPLWKNIHTVLGIWLSLGALAFVLTGLPWTGFWGKRFNALATSASLGAPPGARAPLQSHLEGTSTQVRAQSSDNSMPGMVMDSLPLPQVPWAIASVPVPDSAAVSPRVVPVTIDRVIAQVAQMGVVSGYSLALPASRTGVYTVSYFPADPKDERTISLDQYSGAVLRDIRYRDYGAIAKAVSYGTSLHMGRYFGLTNQIISVLISLGLGAMAVTGGVMWWKRRPVGRLAAPPRTLTTGRMLVWKTGLVLLGAMFPLMGVTILLVWVLERVSLYRGRRTACLSV